MKPYPFKGFWIPFIIFCIVFLLFMFIGSIDGLFITFAIGFFYAYNKGLKKNQNSYIAASREDD